MDSYLAIAEQVLRESRRSMTAIQILRHAYASDMAPSHLRGRTQHKTLQARLSEDILKHRDGSKFYRTAPGKFLLRELIDDPVIPKEDRTPIIARRRRRDLPTDRALAFEWSEISPAMAGTCTVKSSRLLKLIEDGRFHYTSNAPRKRRDDVVLWSFVIVTRNSSVLTYRQGAYREQRDPFLLKRTIGFYTPVVDEDNTLFDREDHGIVSSGLRALATDLGFTFLEALKAVRENADLQGFFLPKTETPSGDLLALVSFECPDWLEPTRRRLAINDLEWLDLKTLPNHQEDFDPWSQAILAEARRIALSDLP